VLSRLLPKPAYVSSSRLMQLTDLVYSCDVTEREESVSIFRRKKRADKREERRDIGTYNVEV
jgi:hypothetical protein